MKWIRKIFGLCEHQYEIVDEDYFLNQWYEGIDQLNKASK